MLTKFVPIFSTIVLVFIRTQVSPQSQDSSLARKLLRGYEKLPPPGALTSVKFGIYINYFFAISEQSMDYRMSFYLRQNWTDPRLQFNASRNFNKTRLKLEDSQINEVWIPDVFFRNEKGAGYHYVTQANRLFYIYDNGLMWYVSKITATFSCPMKLQKYPMDVQYCPLQLESFGYTTDMIEFRWIKPKHKAVEFDKTGKEQPESVVSPDVILDDCTYNDTSGFTDKRIPCLEAKFMVTRPMGYFLIQFYIPSVLLVILSFVSFWISVDAVVARVNIGLMSVLNLVTQSTGSRNQLPKVSYVKAIDVWMTACLVFAFASLIEFAVVNVWSRMEENMKQQAAAAQQQQQQQQQATAQQPAVQQQQLQQSPQEPQPKQSSQQHQKHSQQLQTRHQLQQQPHQQQTRQQLQQSQKLRYLPLQSHHQLQQSRQHSQHGFHLRPQHLSRATPPSQQVFASRRNDHEIIPMLPLNEAPAPAASDHQNRQSWARKRLRALTSSFSKEQPRAQRLDQLSRKLFPLTFILFNIVYWTAYSI